MSERLIVIAGVPRAGKTTLAAGIAGGPVRHTDDLIAEHDWSAASARVARWLDEPGPWVVEGVATVRAIRKWIVAHPTGAVPFEIVWMGEARGVPTPGQAAMARGCHTIWREILPALQRRGAVITRK